MGLRELMGLLFFRLLKAKEDHMSIKKAR